MRILATSSAMLPKTTNWPIPGRRLSKRSPTVRMHLSIPATDQPAAATVWETGGRNSVGGPLVTGGEKGRKHASRVRGLEYLL